MESNQTHHRQMLRVLFVEDNANDANLSIRQLEQAGFELSVDLVRSSQEFTTALRSKPYDIVLSDYALPGWSGIDALEMLQLTGEDIPFILLTGTLGEEIAVECMRKGVTDYILKDQSARLPLAVKRALEERAARAQHKSAEALLHLRTSALEATANAILITDRTGQIVWVNPAFSTLTGYTVDEVIGKNPRILKSGNQAAAFYRNLWETILSGQVWHGEMVNRRKDGTLYTEEATIAPVRNQQGEITHFIDIKQDITDRKQSEEAIRKSESRFRRLAESNIIGIMVADFGGRILEANEAYLQMLGYTCEELLSGVVRWDQTVPAEYRHLTDRAVEQLKTLGACTPWEAEGIRKDGSRISILIGLALLEESEGLAIGFILDLTDRKMAEKQMVKAKEAAEAASRVKSEFLANMSHEIRTPMNGIMGMTQLALDTELTSEQQEYLDLIKSSADSLLTVINDILDFSRIDAGKLSLDAVEFDVRDSLNETISLMAPSCDHKGLELILDIHPSVPAFVRGDPTRLRQVIVNLVGNAIKFTEEGEILLRVETESEDGSIGLHFMVRDTGIGIPQEKQQVVFEAFAQADGSTTRKFGGTGLGLTISAALVEMMGGRIWVESEVGRGSRFHFTTRFERVETPTTPVSEPVLELIELTRVRVLIVDDNATNRRWLGELLKSWGVTIELASSVGAAVEVIRKARSKGCPFDIVLTDGQMPEADGFVLARQIRQDPELMRAVVMMLSSSGLRGEAVRCKELGVAAYLTKPIRQRDLREAIGRVLQPCQQTRAESGLITRHTVREARRGLRILLVEDNPVSLRLAGRLLERRGHQVVTATNGREALAILANERFDLAVTDVEMPEIDGFELVSAIRTSEKNTEAHLPIIAMTAHAMNGDRERCLASGMDAYVTKPIRADELCETIENVAVVPLAKR